MHGAPSRPSHLPRRTEGRTRTDGSGDELGLCGVLLGLHPPACASELVVGGEILRLAPYHAQRRPAHPPAALKATLRRERAAGSASSSSAAHAAGLSQWRGRGARVKMIRPTVDRCDLDGAIGSSGGARRKGPKAPPQLRLWLAWPGAGRGEDQRCAAVCPALPCAIVVAQSFGARHCLNPAAEHPLARGHARWSRSPLLLDRYGLGLAAPWGPRARVGRPRTKCSCMPCTSLHLHIVWSRSLADCGAVVAAEAAHPELTRQPLPVEGSEQTQAQRPAHPMQRWAAPAACTPLCHRWGLQRPCGPWRAAHRPRLPLQAPSTMAALASKNAMRSCRVAAAPSRAALRSRRVVTVQVRLSEPSGAAIGGAGGAAAGRRRPRGLAARAGGPSRRSLRR